MRSVRLFFFAAIYSFLAAFLMLVSAQETFLHEGFESGKPAGWIEIPTKWEVDGEDSTAIPWKFKSGVHMGFPDTAAVGDSNALFNYESYSGEATMLVTPVLNLEYAIKPALFFYHIMPVWVSGEHSWHDFLKVYYRKGTDKPWVLLRHYENIVDNWTMRELNIPDSALSSTFQIAFEGITNYGYGVGIDEVIILETEVAPRIVIYDTVSQASTDFVASNTMRNPILQIELFVYGNQEEEILNSITITSLNTDDTEVIPNGVRLFATQDPVFSSREPIGTSSGFVGGEAVFNEIGYSLKTGHNSIWISYDIAEEAEYGNIMDAKIEAHAIVTSKGTYPAAEISPAGSRWVTGTIFFDDFETDKAWVLTKEWQRDTAQGKGGGDGGYPSAEEAYSGDRIIGTDITGLGEWEGNYEPNISPLDPYLTISPKVDCYYYKDVTLSFQRWLNIDMWDVATIDLTKDGGASWHRVYRNTGFVAEYQWGFIDYNISGFADRADSLQVRFGILSSVGFNNFSGWNIDDILLSGSFINADVGVIDILQPFNGAHHTSEEEIIAKVKNFGAARVEPPIPIAAYFDDGKGHAFFVQDTIYETIEPEDTLLFHFTRSADLTHPGKYTFRVVSELEDDEYRANDTLTETLYVIPTLEAPYEEDFEEDDHYWLVNFTPEYGENRKNTSWELGIPSEGVLSPAGSGQRAWVTRLGAPYRSFDTSRLYSPYLDISNLDKPMVEFLTHRSLRDGDGYVLEYSVDTAKTWHTLLRHDTTVYPYDWNWYNNDSVHSLGGEGWDGTLSAWRTTRQFLPEHLKVKEVQFRFTFISGDNSMTYREGAAIDRFRLIEVPPDIRAHAIVSPESACELSTEELVVVAFENVGYLPLPLGDTLVFVASLDSVKTVMDTMLIDSHIAVGDTFHFPFTKGLDFGVAGEYELSVYSIYPDDRNIYSDIPYNNDTIRQTIWVQRPFVDLGPDIYTVFPDTVVLEAFTLDTLTYAWNTGDSIPNLAIDQEGVYHVTVSNSLCDAYDTIQVYKLIADVSLALVSPQSACHHPDPVSVTMRLNNRGTDTIRPGVSLEVFYQLADNQWHDTTYVFSDTLYPDSIQYISFPDLHDLSQVADYQFRSYLVYAIDEKTGNDSVEMLIHTRGEPLFSLQPDSLVFLGMQYPLDAAYQNDPMSFYLWEDGSEDTVFTVKYPADSYYHVTVTDHFGCTTSDSAYVLLIVPDVGVVGSIIPENSCGPIVDEYVKIKIANLGTSDIPKGTTIPIRYQIGDSEIKQVEWYLTNPFVVEDTITFVIDKKVTYDEYGEYYFMAYTDLESDSVYENDTLHLDFLITPVPIVDLGEEMRVVYAHEELLDAGNYESYIWHDGSDERYYLLNASNNIPPGWVGVTVTDANGCTGSDQTIVVLDFKDVTMLPLLSQDTTCGFSHHDSEVVTFKNVGTQALDPFDTLMLSYYVDSMHIRTDTLKPEKLITQLQSFEHTLNGRISIENRGFHELSFIVTMRGDQNRSNDTVAHSFYALGLPQIVWPTEKDTDTISLELPDVLNPENDTFTHYLWSTGATTPMIRVDYIGWYTLAVKDHNRCIGKDSIFVEHYVGIGLYSDNMLKLQMYPNPFSDKLCILVSSSRIYEDLWLTLISSDGVVHKKKRLNTGKAEHWEGCFDLSKLSPGIYKALISDEKGACYVRTLVKE